jgi:hypothetical protein
MNRRPAPLSPLRCADCRHAIGLTERFERVDRRNYHVGYQPAGRVSEGGR